MTYLELFMGPMFSGKSSKLVEVINEHKTNPRIKQLIINHASDIRYGSNSIITHNNDAVPCHSLSQLNEILELPEYMSATHIYIDEGQFFPDLKDSVALIMLNSMKHIYVAGLDSDFEIKPFANLGILSLIPLANKITKFTSRCYICQQSAPYTMRISESNAQILVGTNNEYQPVCFRHHNKVIPHLGI